MKSITTAAEEIKAARGGGRPYIVDVLCNGVPLQRRIVWALNQAQARLHVARDLIGVKAADASDMASIWGTVKIEYATGVTARKSSVDDGAPIDGTT